MLALDLPIPDDLTLWVERINLVKLDPNESFPTFAGARVHLGFIDYGEVRFNRNDTLWLRDLPACWGASPGVGVVSAGDFGARCILIKLAAGIASAVLGQSPECCSEQTLPLRNFWPWLKSAPDSISGTALVLHYLAQLRTAIHRGQDRLSWQPAQCIEVACALDSLSIKAAADSLGISRITLERQIWKSFGVAPKSLSRIQRFYRALSWLPQMETSAVAQEAGYYDQSHMIAEFRSMSGLTPLVVRKLARTCPEQLQLYVLPPSSRQAGC